MEVRNPREEEKQLLSMHWRKIVHELGKEGKAALPLPRYPTHQGVPAAASSICRWTLPRSPWGWFLALAAGEFVQYGEKKAAGWDGEEAHTDLTR